MRLRLFAFVAIVATVAAPHPTGYLAQLDGSSERQSDHLKALFDAGQFDDGQYLAAYYVEANKARFGESATSYAIVTGWLGVFLKEKAKYARAEPLLKKSLSILAMAPVLSRRDTREQALILAHLGKLYQLRDRPTEAENALRQSLDIREGLDNDKEADVASGLTDLAMLYRDTDRYREAEQIFQRASGIAEMNFGANSLSVATVSDGLGRLNRSMERYQESEANFKRALAIRERLLPADHPDIATVLNALSVLYGQQERYEEAEVLLRRVIAIQMKVFRSVHPDLANSTQNLAYVLNAMNRTEESEQFFKRALAMYEETLGRDDKALAAPLKNLADLHAARGEEARAILLLERARQIEEKAYGSAHRGVAATLRQLGRISEKQERLVEAEAQYRQALAIRRKAEGVSSRHLGVSLDDLARLSAARGNKAQAESLYKEAVAVAEKTADSDRLELASALSALGVFYYNDGRYRDAEPLFERALAIREVASEPGESAMFSARTNLMSVYQQLGRKDEAEALDVQRITVTKATSVEPRDLLFEYVPLLPHADFPVEAVEFSPDGATLATATGFGVKLWEVSTGRLLRDFAGYRGPIASIAFSPDGAKIVTGDLNNEIKVWNVETGQLLLSVRLRPGGSGIGNPDRVHAVTFSPDSSRILAGIEGSLDEDRNGVRLIDAMNGKILKAAPRFDGRSGCLKFSPDGTLAAFRNLDNEIEVWSVSAWHKVQALKGHSDEILSIAFSPNGRFIVSGGFDKKVILWNVSNGHMLRAFDGFANNLDFSWDGSRIYAGGEKTRIWDTETGELLRTFDREGRAFATESERGIEWSGEKMVVWDTRSSRVLTSIPIRVVGGAGAAVISYSDDGLRILARRPFGKLPTTAWHTSSGRYLGNSAINPPWPGGSPGSVVSPNGKFRAQQDNLAAVFTEIVSGKKLGEYSEPTASPFSAAFSPDSTRLVTSGGYSGAVHMWSTSNWKRLGTYFDHDDVVWTLIFSRDGKYFVSASSDKTVKLWESKSMRVVHTLRGHTDEVWGAAFSPDGERIISVGKDKTVRIWEATTGQPLATLIADESGEWLAITPEGFFNGTPKGAELLTVVRGLRGYSVGQMFQSLYAPDLVREKLAGDPDELVAKAATVTSLDKVIASGAAPKVAITSPISGANSANEVIAVEATIATQDGGVGRIEWRVNGITVGVSNPEPDADGTLRLERSIALDPGDNTIEVIAYNSRNLLASVPAKTMVSLHGSAMKKPTLHVLAIGINRYVDTGGIAEGETTATHFPPLGLAVADAKALASELDKAGRGLYGEVKIRTVLDEEATADNLDRVVAKMAMDIQPRDTFVFYAASHGYSHGGRFYLIPQDYQGGTDPRALRSRAIDQLKLQDWIVNRVKAKKALILLDSCESGALTAGYTRSRLDSATSDAAIGRLHEATGRPVLTAAGLGQSALEFTDLGHGVFTSALIDALYRGDENNDRMVSLSELVSHVQNLVPRLVKDPKARAEVLRRGTIDDVQSPRFGGHGQDFAFVQRLQ